MRIKKGVLLANMTPQIVLAANIADLVYLKHAGHEATMTSAFDGKHGANSLHHRHGICNAIDLRIRDVGGEISEGARDAIVKTIVAELKKRLGENYDVVLEATHIHIEYDPK